MAVHTELGPGLRERIYQRALAMKLDEAGIRHDEEHYVRIELDGARAGFLYLDHLVEDSVIVEIKARRHPMTNDEIGQVVTYLAATGYRVGLLLNFGRKSLEYRRILPPREIDSWRNSVGRYLWRPPQSAATP